MVAACGLLSYKFYQVKAFICGGALSSPSTGHNGDPLDSSQSYRLQRAPYWPRCGKRCLAKPGILLLSRLLGELLNKQSLAFCELFLRELAQKFGSEYFQKF